MFNIVNLPTESLRPNDYNPNMMTHDEFEELVCEVKRLKRIPKPIVVRKEGQDYSIIDGEHNWKAAQEAGLKKLPCEIVEADDFESMFQTFKRNQHGTHNPVKLGKMFQRMMKEKNLSQRELAKEMSISEGTVRNSLEYVKASAVRNDYAFEKLSIPQVRTYNRLPRIISDIWLNCGADPKKSGLYWRFDEDEDEDPEAVVGWGSVDESYADPLFWQGMDYKHSPKDFEERLKKIHGWKHLEQIYSWEVKGEKCQIREYTKIFYRDDFSIKEARQFSELMFSYVIDTDSKPPRFRLDPEEFKELFWEATKKCKTYDDFSQFLKASLAEKTGIIIRDSRDAKTRLQEIEIGQEAPDYIQESRLSVTSKYILWKTEGPEWKKREIAQMEGYKGIIPDDKIKGLLFIATRRDELISKFGNKSDIEIAREIAMSFPIHRKEQDIEAIETLANRLVLLTKRELLTLYECINYMASLKGLADVLNSM